MSLVVDPRSVNSSTGKYLMRSFAIEPPEKRFMPGCPSLRNYGQRLSLGIDCDEVYPGIIIGSGATAKNTGYLNKIGITHILNTAENDVNLNPSKLAKQGICYKGFRCLDVPHADISQYFEECTEFLDLALSFRTTKVFVACLLGFSRSTAIVAAYMMKKKGFTATQAIAEMRTVREVKPNVGFLQQLGKLDDELRRQKYYRKLI